MDDRPPTVSVLFFLAALAVLIAMWVAAHRRETPTSARAVRNAEAAAPASTREDRVRRFAENWPREPDFALVFNALDPSFDIVETAAIRFDPADDYFGLPRSEGYYLVYGYCGACHSLRIVMQQHATRERWVELLQWMHDKQGMPEPAPGEKAVLIDYLAGHFGAGD